MPYKDTRKTKAYQDNRKAKLRKQLSDYKTTLKCSKCPEAHSACLDFHHIDPTTKSFGLGQAIHKQVSWDKIINEIRKCIVLCANCHRKEHSS
jgi:hypothetical protein